MSFILNEVQYLGSGSFFFFFHTNTLLQYHLWKDYAFYIEFILHLYKKLVGMSNIIKNAEIDTSNGQSLWRKI